MASRAHEGTTPADQQGRMRRNARGAGRTAARGARLKTRWRPRQLDNCCVRLTELAEAQRAAQRNGRVCAVAALIRDSGGRVLVQRRGPGRSLLPNCWDIVGGHVDVGEDLLTALRREVEEETGWRVRDVPELMHVEDWEWQNPDGVERVREFDFYVEVEGDLEHPRLEVPKHTEFRWVALGETALLDENRGLDGGYIRRIVEKALAGGNLSEHPVA